MKRIQKNKKKSRFFHNPRTQLNNNAALNLNSQLQSGEQGENEEITPLQGKEGLKIQMESFDKNERELAAITIINLSKNKNLINQIIDDQILDHLLTGILQTDSENLILHSIHALINLINNEQQLIEEKNPLNIQIANTLINKGLFGKLEFLLKNIRVFLNKPTINESEIIISTTIISEVFKLFQLISECLEEKQLKLLTETQAGFNIIDLCFFFIKYEQCNQEVLGFLAVLTEFSAQMAIFICKNQTLMKILIDTIQQGNFNNGIHKKSQTLAILYNILYENVDFPELLPYINIGNEFIVNVLSIKIFDEVKNLKQITINEKIQQQQLLQQQQKQNQQAKQNNKQIQQQQKNGEENKNSVIENEEEDLQNEDDQEDIIEFEINDANNGFTQNNKKQQQSKNNQQNSYLKNVLKIWVETSESIKLILGCLINVFEKENSEDVIEEISFDESDEDQMQQLDKSEQELQQQNNNHQQTKNSNNQQGANKFDDISSNQVKKLIIKNLFEKVNLLNFFNDIINEKLFFEDLQTLKYFNEQENDFYQIEELVSDIIEYTLSLLTNFGLNYAKEVQNQQLITIVIQKTWTVLKNTKNQLVSQLQIYKNLLQTQNQNQKNQNQQQQQQQQQQLEQENDESSNNNTNNNNNQRIIDEEEIKYFCTNQIKVLIKQERLYLTFLNSLQTNDLKQLINSQEVIQFFDFEISSLTVEGIEEFVLVYLEILSLRFHPTLSISLEENQNVCDLLVQILNLNTNVMVQSQVLNAIFDIYSDEAYDQVFLQKNLYSILSQGKALMDQKIKELKKTLTSENYQFVKDILSNLKRFLKYKQQNIKEL